MQATAYTYDPTTRTGSVLLDDGTPMPFDAAAFDAGGLRLLRPGQRVRVEVADAAAASRGGEAEPARDPEAGTGPGSGPRITLVTLQTL